MSSIFNKIKDLNKGVECALNQLLVINRTASVFVILLRDPM